jgi:drug/metabolite transporter (DMT)-like permease
VTRRRAEAALVFNTLVWGATFVVVKEALEDVSAILFLALRFTLATAALMVLFRGSWSNPRLARQALWGGLLAGVFLFAGYLFQTVGLRFTTAPKSAFITGLTAAMAPLLAWFVYRNRPRIAEAAGVLLCTAGMGLMTLEGSSWSVARGDLLTFFCTIGFAAHILVLSHFSKRTSWEVMSVAQIGVSAALAWSMFWWVETPFLRWSPKLLFAIAVTGLLATALAFSIMAWAQRHTTPTRTALIFTLEPVFAWITSWLVAGETLSPRAAGGAALILGGVLCVELKPFGEREHPSN